MRSLWTILLIIPLSIFSQTIVSEGSSKYKLESVVEVEVFQQKNCAQCYYYLPTNLNLSYKDSEPEISLIKWDTDGDTKAGAILHFLIKWDLSKKQQTNLQYQISNLTESKAVIMGPASVETIAQDQFFYGEDYLVTLLNQNLNSIPPIATTPGAKMAFSFRFNGADVADFLASLNEIEKSIGYLKLSYLYKLDGKIQTLNLKLELREIFKYLKK